ncbi:redoxin family protein [Solirubrobacter sp. CPCC 204708]|uniref:Redoxin family protein n=1 Tax=Solirubrobacter deserti TaxID=2282478 RepID=A0ABT4RPS5_9ACTN|nr:cytochrome c biogenesis protein CcdA [Solirubrobacter deserti]MBE2316670.1 redoxin family protein [Solirubrobacter deserti]MDA0140568.1 redoxin family protein [Solirubrobacter deserti]
MRTTSRALACAALIWAGLAAPAHAQSGQVGTPAPEFSATTLDDATPVTVAEQRGKAVLLNKWSTWCKPCVEEMPFLEELQQRYADRGFTVVGVSIDRPGSDGNVRRVAEERGVTYPVWLDPQDAFTPTFRSTGVPESVLLDKNGVVVRRWPGALTEDDTTIDAAIERAIASSGAYVKRADTETKEASAISFGVVGALAAVIAGLLSFLSPCVLPLVPSYVALLAGVRGAGAKRASRRETLTHAVAFVLGFSAVFIALGASATALGDALRGYDEWITRIGGVLLIAFGVMLLGLIPLAILQRDTRLLDRASTLRRFGPVGSAAVGAAFGAGWTPCIGPVLAGILALAASSGSAGEGVILLAAYSLGLAIPFLAAAFAVDRFRVRGPGGRRWLPWVNRVSGGLLVALGILLITGALTQMSEWAARFTPAWLG